MPVRICHPSDVALRAIICDILLLIDAAERSQYPICLAELGVASASTHRLLDFLASLLPEMFLTRCKYIRRLQIPAHIYDHAQLLVRFGIHVGLPVDIVA